MGFLVKVRRAREPPACGDSESEWVRPLGKAVEPHVPRAGKSLCDSVVRPKKKSSSGRGKDLQTRTFINNMCVYYTYKICVCLTYTSIYMT